jgi:hypothetical protein
MMDSVLNKKAAGSVRIDPAVGIDWGILLWTIFSLAYRRQ